MDNNEGWYLFLDKSMLDLIVVHRLSARFSDISGVYMYGLNQDGEIISDITGDEHESKRLIGLIGNDCLDSLFHRLSDSELETQAIEETSVPNVNIAGVSMFIDHVPVITWIFIGVLKDSVLCELPGAVSLSDYSNVTSQEKFLNIVDVVRDTTQLIVGSSFSVASAEAESRRSKYSEEELKSTLNRVEAVSSIVQLLDDDNSIESIMEKCMGLMGEYLNVSTALVVRTRRGRENMDVAAIWNNKGVISPEDSFADKPIFSFVMGEKPVVISTENIGEGALAEEMAFLEAKALVALPIHVIAGHGMYAVLLDNSKRQWQIEDIKFIYDAGHILHSIVNKRIQKNSLAGSYASLESVLDNVGSAIYVRDIDTNTPLFMNRVLKNTFATELQNHSLDKLFDDAIPKNRASGNYEINHLDRNRWYDLHYTYINWVDGRKVSLCAAYDVTDKKTYQRRIEQQACTDFLTGLYNRMCCERDLALHVDEAKNEKTAGALLYLDLDDFKHINDGLGHQYGDVLLKAISHSLQRIDGIQNTCYRMGGDEFVIIVPPDAYKNFENIVEGIKEIFSKPWYLKDADYYCTMSMGVVEFPKSGESVQELIKKADLAMYEAKKGGKNRVAIYSDSIESSSNRRLDMEKNMRDAVSGEFKEFKVFYQPIVDAQLPGSPCIGAEALIRWNSAELGFIPPGDFIPLAEYLGLINPIGNNVLKEACEEVKKWNENGHPNFKVNVNLSVVQLLQTDIVDIVKKTIEETGVNPQNLTLEVTESLAINDMDRMKSILSNIKTFGVKIALDDFGTGYSSLNHIREIPFDIIKVDQSFVKDLAEDAYSQSFIKMVSELAETIGVNVCVEGIETKEQFKVLEGMKVKMIQGYLFDRPLSKEDFERKYVGIEPAEQ